MRTTQLDRLVKSFAAGKTMTSAQAKARGVSRLAARVHDLKAEGFKFVTEDYVKRNGATASKYRLAAKSRKTRPAK